MDKSIFRAYDIRGIYPTELNNQDAYKIARAIFEYSKCKKVAVGRDARLSAPVIHQAVCQGFLDVGCEVTDLGMISTDMKILAAGKLDFDIVINVTASHNPKNWIGIKIDKRGGDTVGGAGEIQKIGTIAADLNIQYPISNERTIKKLVILDDWIQHVLSFVDVSKIKPFKIVVDAGNGVAGPIVRAWAKHLPISLVELYFEPNGNFPNHLPGSIKPEDTEDLRRKVIETKADLGMGFDGDADRVFLVDEKGQLVTGSEMTAMVLDVMLSEDPSRIVLYNAICNWNVLDVIKKYKAKAYRTKVGSGYIKKDMRKYNAYFAGEHSGHYFFKSNFCGDSGLVAVMFVLALLSKQNKNLSQILKSHRRYEQMPETNFRVKDVDMILGALEERYQEGAIDYLDGLTVNFPDFWFNLRLSANEPLLRLNLEARDKKTLEKIQQEVSDIITQLTQIST